MDFDIPIFGKPVWLIGVFFVSLALFHMVLIGWLQLTKRQWRQIDYLWISIGVLGLFGSGISLRRPLAVEFLEIAQARLAAKHQALIVRARELSDSRVCRTAVRSESSRPSSDETQIEFEKVDGVRSGKRFPRAPWTGSDPTPLTEDLTPLTDWYRY
jgi:hypothetical protein